MRSLCPVARRRRGKSCSGSKLFYVRIRNKKSYKKVRGEHCGQ